MVPQGLLGEHKQKHEMVTTNTTWKLIRLVGFRVLKFTATWHRLEDYSGQYFHLFWSSWLGQLSRQPYPISLLDLTRQFMIEWTGTSWVISRLVSLLHRGMAYFLGGRAQVFTACVYLPLHLHEDLTDAGPLCGEWCTDKCLSLSSHLLPCGRGQDQFEKMFGFCRDFTSSFVGRGVGFAEVWLSTT